MGNVGSSGVAGGAFGGNGRIGGGGLGMTVPGRRFDAPDPFEDTFSRDFINRGRRVDVQVMRQVPFAEFLVALAQAPNGSVNFSPGWKGPRTAAEFQEAGQERYDKYMRVWAVSGGGFAAGAAGGTWLWGVLEGATAGSAVGPAGTVIGAVVGLATGLAVGLILEEIRSGGYEERPQGRAPRPPPGPPTLEA